MATLCAHHTMRGPSRSRRLFLSALRGGMWLALLYALFFQRCRNVRARNYMGSLIISVCYASSNALRMEFCSVSSVLAAAGNALVSVEKIRSISCVTNCAS